jgi:hypothetical protein
VRLHSAKIRLRLNRLADDVEARAQRAVRAGATIVARSWWVWELGTPGGVELVVYAASCDVHTDADAPETARRLLRSLRAEFGGELVGDPAVTVAPASA